MRNQARVLAITLALVAPACGAGGGDDVPPLDAAAADLLVGSWRALPYAFQTPPPPIEQRNYQIYGDDGTLEYRIDSPTVRRFTYEVSADGMTITTHATDGGEPSNEQFMFAFVDGVLVDNVLLPAGSGDGPVDVWTSHGSYDDEPLTLTWDLRADHSAVLTAMRPAIGTRTFPGHWAAQGADILLTVQIDQLTTEQLTGRLVDHKLGVPYERLP